MIQQNNPDNKFKESPDSNPETTHIDNSGSESPSRDSSSDPQPGADKQQNQPENANTENTKKDSADPDPSSQQQPDDKETKRKSSQEHKTHKEPPKQMLVRYGLMGHLGWFEHHEKHICPTKTHAVIKTDRGLELGRIVGNFNYRHGQFKCSCKEVSDYYGQGEQRCPVYSGGSFVRFGTHEDLNEARHLEISSKEEMKTCRKFIRELDLPMKLVDSEHLFGGERIVFYFTSDGRVDFRELVKRLAKEYQTRIELRQIGSRDEARILADFESCGQEVCCKRFLKILEPVNMKMAKLQKATLDPSKISGHCGRLKCCLRYEDQTYRELKRNMPRKNSFVKTANGIGKVFDSQILTQLVVVQYENGDREAWPVEELTPADPKEAAKYFEERQNSNSRETRNARTRDAKPKSPAPEKDADDFDIAQEESASDQQADSQPAESQGDRQETSQANPPQPASDQPNETGEKQNSNQGNRSRRNKRGRSSRSNQNSGQGGENQNKAKRRRKNRRGRKQNPNKNNNSGSDNKDN